jgi:ribosome-associated protein
MLRAMHPIRVTPDVVVPSAAMAWRAVRSSGPGGQNVNKVSSKVELRVDVARIVGMDELARERLRNLALLDADGRLLVVSQRTRDQRLNIEDAREKVRALVARAVVRPRPRRATRPTRGSVQRRLDDKRRRSETKSSRRGQP